MKNSVVLFAFMIIVTFGCVEPPDYPIEPAIAFMSISSNEIVAQTIPEDPNRQTDTLVVTFSFTDGDGDLGGGTSSNVFFFDSRLGNQGEVFFIDEIPQQGASNGISGEITIRIPSIFCFPNSEPRDTMSYSIQIKDRAGHLSNVIQTPPFVLICD